MNEAIAPGRFSGKGAQPRELVVIFTYMSTNFQPKPTGYSLGARIGTIRKIAKHLESKSHLKFHLKFKSQLDLTTSRQGIYTPLVRIRFSVFRRFLVPLKHGFPSLFVYCSQVLIFSWLSDSSSFRFGRGRVFKSQIASVLAQA